MTDDGDDIHANSEPMRRVPVETRCTGAAIRRAARRVTQIYDDALRPLGLKLTQYSLLANIVDMDRPSITDLADHLEMDRTTLTRNLAPLRTAGWVQQGTGPDKRRRSVVLTPEGEAMLATARPLWHDAELEVRRLAGEERTSELRRLLRETVESISTP